MGETCRRISRVERNSRRINRYIGKHSRSWIGSYRDAETEGSNIESSRSIPLNLEKVHQTRIERHRSKEKERTSILKDKQMKVITGVTAAAIGAGSAVYVGGHIYFEKHFYAGSTINNIDVSLKTIDEADEALNSYVNSYALKLDGRDGVSEEIKAEDINLIYDKDKKNQIQVLKDAQNNDSWIKSIYSTKHAEDIDIVKFDDNLLNGFIDNLSYFKADNITEPQDASYKFEDNEFKIVDEVYGNKIDKDKLREAVAEAIKNNNSVLDLDESNCYINPQHTAESSEVIEGKKKLDEYAGIVINYKFGEQTELVDASLISQWIDIDKDFNVTLNHDKVYQYVEGLAQKYNTVGKTRNITGSSGRSVEISGGDYGWSIDVDAETNELINLIESRQSQDREPVYKQTALAKGTNDIGNTYVEIDMRNQYLWFYKDGSLITEGNVVTGNVANGTSTPEGIYTLKYKQRDTVLVGPNYKSPVTFWMPFNGGIGIHDASWRGSFGGNIYRSSGSHGCVNAPYYLANKIFQNIESGTPVVCYN